MVERIRVRTLFFKKPKTLNRRPFMVFLGYGFSSSYEKMRPFFFSKKATVFFPLDFACKKYSSGIIAFVLRARTTASFTFDMTTTTTTEEETTTTTTTTKSIVLLVKLLPEPNREEHKGLTRFQIRDPRSKCLGKTCVFRDLEPTTTTVADVKRMVERDVGEKVEMLRRGERKTKNSRGRFVFRFFVSLSVSRGCARAKRNVCPW